MKKVIITEEQRNLMESFFLFENDEQKKENLKDFGAKLGQEFSKALRDAKVNTGMVLVFGKTDKENKIVPESVVSYGTIVTKIDNLNHMLVLAVVSSEYTQNSGSAILQPKTLIGIPLEKPLLVHAATCKLSTMGVKDYDPDNDNGMRYDRPKFVPDFLTFENHGDLSIKRIGDETEAGAQTGPEGGETIDVDYEDVTGPEGGETIDVDYEDVTDVPKPKALNPSEIKAVYSKEGAVKSLARDKTKNLIYQWDERLLQILRSAEFTPGLFRMDNFFFFPKGYAVMDDILSKYGMYVERKGGVATGEDNTKRGVEIKVLEDIVDKEGNILVHKNKKGEGVVIGRRNYISINTEDGINSIALVYEPRYKPQNFVNSSIPVKPYFINVGIVLI
jgi:hypothetical protein